MSWKKYFRPVATDTSGSYSPVGNGGGAGPARSNYSSYLPDVYAGSPNRVERYQQYETMDMDSEINAALDILAEFCTDKDSENKTPFQFNFSGRPTSTETKLLNDALVKWCKFQEFETRIFRMVRNVFKYGDCFFIRDPETCKLLYVEPAKVSKIIVNESTGKTPEQYIVQDLNFNFVENVAVTPFGTSNNAPSGTSSYVSGGAFGRGYVGDVNQPTGTRFQKNQNETAIDAKHILHLSLSEGIDSNYPSSSTGGGQSVIDASYNPLSTNEDYFFPQTAEGRGSKVDTLPGGTNLGEITDLKYFTNKLFRALRIPSSYLPTTIDEQPNTVADGKVGTAYIQELRFNKYCERLQSTIVEVLDQEFKLWLYKNGYNIDSSLFNIQFCPPQNFAAYRQAELDATRANLYGSIADIPFLSKRFAMKRYLGLTPEEIAENERLWQEENANNLNAAQDANGQMRGAGISPAGIEADLGAEDAEAPADIEPGGDEPEASPLGGTETPPGDEG